MNSDWYSELRPTLLGEGSVARLLPVSELDLLASSIGVSLRGVVRVDGKAHAASLYDANYSDTEETADSWTVATTQKRRAADQWFRGSTSLTRPFTIGAPLFRGSTTGIQQPASYT